MTKHKILVLSDFNGTISLSNIAEHILEKFADKKWLYYDKLCLEGKMSLDEAMVYEYSLLKAPVDEILNEVDRIYQIRSHFKDFIEYCKTNTIPFVIVTTGLDFVINHMLQHLGVADYVELVAFTTEVNPDKSLKINNIERFDESKKDFKSDYVSYYKELGCKVVYIGDSFSDFNAVLESDIVFSVRNSKLSAYCEEKSITFSEFDDFSELTNKIEIKTK